MPAKKESESFKCPLFLLPGVILFPGMNLPLHIFEEKYMIMISQCLEGDKRFGAVYLRGNVCAEIGTIAEIINVEKLEDGKFNLLTEGKQRFKIVDLISEKPFYQALVEIYKDKQEKVTEKMKKSINEIRDLSKIALKLFDKVSKQELSKKIDLPEDPNELLFLIAANLSCSHEIKQSILESRSVRERAKKIHKLLKEEIDRLEVILQNKKTKDVVEQNGHLGFEDI